MPVSAHVRASINVSQTGAPSVGSSVFQVPLEYSINLTDGVAADQANIVYVAERTVASAANDDIDLAGVLTDAFGATITMAELVGIMIINQQKDGTVNTTNLTIGGGSNPFLGFLGGTTPTVGPLRPGTCIQLTAPHASGLGTVVAGTGDILRIANSSGATAKYMIALIARNA